MRLTPQEGEEMLLHGDPIALGRLADAERHRRYPSDRVTFIIDRNINYTNVCVNECRFCAFSVAREAGTLISCLMMRFSIKSGRPWQLVVRRS